MKTGWDSFFLSLCFFPLSFQHNTPEQTPHIFVWRTRGQLKDFEFDVNKMSMCRHPGETFSSQESIFDRALFSSGWTLFPRCQLERREPLKIFTGLKCFYLLFQIESPSMYLIIQYTELDETIPFFPACPLSYLTYCRTRACFSTPPSLDVVNRDRNVPILRPLAVSFQMGYTPIHIAAKHGHLDLINKFASSNVNLRQLSRKTGLSALHIASYFGEEGAWKSFWFYIVP